MMWPKEVRRTVDYLETRPDVDVSRLAYYGVSMGAASDPSARGGTANPRRHPRGRRLLFPTLRERSIRSATRRV